MNSYCVRLTKINNKPYSLQVFFKQSTSLATNVLPKQDDMVVAEYIFREVNFKELFELRLSKHPGVVCKMNGELFYTDVPASLRLANQEHSLQMPHLCGKNCTQVCNGCPRTSDLTVSFQVRNHVNFVDAVYESWRIEKYPFIKEGIEAFNMDITGDALIVGVCSNFQERPPRNDNSHKLSVQKKLSLASLYWDDFDGDYMQLRERINKASDNGKKESWYL